MNKTSGTVLVAGGAGFLGSHLCQALLTRGQAVICVDNFITSEPSRVAHLLENELFHMIEADIVDNDALTGLARDHELSAILNLASPASPPAYLKFPIETLQVGSAGMKNLLDLAVLHRSRVLHASTSEIYGDPEIHPQPETYWGNVNPIGPRSMYDESKRFAEALCAAYVRHHDLDLRTVRIFNTYGPGMSPDDGRVVTNFICQALRGQPLTIYGTGQQTRSFCYVDDTIRGLLVLLDSNVTGPVNIGNPTEITMIELAELITTITESPSELTFAQLPGDDPKQRQPDIRRARRELGWTPVVELAEGIERTVEWFRSLPEF